FQSISVTTSVAPAAPSTGPASSVRPGVPKYTRAVPPAATASVRPSPSRSAAATPGAAPASDCPGPLPKLPARLRLAAAALLLGSESSTARFATTATSPGAVTVLSTAIRSAAPGAIASTAQSSVTSWLPLPVTEQRAGAVTVTGAG